MSNFNYINNQSGKPQYYKLFVANLPNKTNYKELYNEFAKFGAIFDMAIRDNIAFITYYNKLDSEIAKEKMDKSFFNGDYIRVKDSKSTR